MLWQDIQRDAVRLSRRTNLLRARNSGHQALDDPDDGVSAVRALIGP
jgi:hypothetical protein